MAKSCILALLTDRVVITLSNSISSQVPNCRNMQRMQLVDGEEEVEIDIDPVEEEVIEEEYVDE